MDEPRPVGASPEVIEHHARRHGCPDGGTRHVVCPCGATVALVCTSCNQPVFMAVEPNTWCVHAQELWRWAA